MEFDYDKMKCTRDNIERYFDKINPAKFSYDNFCISAGMNHNDFINENRTFQEGMEVIGYCDGSKVQIRPRFDSIAVMLYDMDSGNQFWFHVYV